MAALLSLVTLVDSMIRRSFRAAGLREETHELDGGETTMHCWVSYAAAAAAAGERKNGDSPTAVLLHGFGPPATWQWHRQVKPLSRRLRLVIPDLVFFGGSATRSRRRSEMFQAECVMKLLDGLGVDRFFVVGASYGGFVAFHVARLAGERAERVVLASSNPLKTAADDEELLARAGMRCVSDLIVPRSSSALRTLIDIGMHWKPPFMPEFLLRDVLRSLFSDNVEEKLELINGLKLDKEGEISRSSLTQEVLLVWGDHDGVFPLEKAHRLKDHLGEKARLHVIKNTGHVPQAEDPSTFNEVILSFFFARAA